MFQSTMIHVIFWSTWSTFPSKIFMKKFSTRAINLGEEELYSIDPYFQGLKFQNLETVWNFHPFLGHIKGTCTKNRKTRGSCLCLYAGWLATANEVAMDWCGQIFAGRQKVLQDLALITILGNVVPMVVFKGTKSHKIPIVSSYGEGYELLCRILLSFTCSAAMVLHLTVCVLSHVWTICLSLSSGILHVVERKKRTAKTRFTCPQLIRDADKIPNGEVFAEALTDAKFKSLLINFISVNFPLLAKSLQLDIIIIIDSQTYGDTPLQIESSECNLLPARKKQQRWCVVSCCCSCQWQMFSCMVLPYMSKAIFSTRKFCRKRARSRIC